MQALFYSGPEFSATGSYDIPCTISVNDGVLCKYAADNTQGWKWDGDRNWSDRPHGCLLTPNGAEVNFNTNSGGQVGNKDQTPICEVSKYP